MEQTTHTNNYGLSVLYVNSLTQSLYSNRQQSIMASMCYT